MKFLFENIDKIRDPHWLVKQVFNSFCEQSHFIDALECVVKKWGITVDVAYCWFPRMQEPDPALHFVGIKFGEMDDEIVISEDDFVKHLIAACREFVKLRPQYHQRVKELLETSKYFSRATTGWDSEQT